MDRITSGRRWTGPGSCRSSLRGLRRRLQPALDEYVAYYQRIYAAIAEVSGSPVVIDSSKHASLAFCLRSSPGLDLRVIHMVRDPGGRLLMEQDRGPAGGRGREPDVHLSAGQRRMRWNLQNSALQLLSQLGTPTLRVRYEDFVRPGGHARPDRRLRRPAGRPGLRLPGHRRTRPRWADWGRRTRRPGNPMRFTTGRIGIRHDDTWQTRMMAGNRRTVTTLTLPLLMRYGYLGGGMSRVP